jgi:hypothetical protein
MRCKIMRKWIREVVGSTYEMSLVKSIASGDAVGDRGPVALAGDNT